MVLMFLLGMGLDMVWTLCVRYVATGCAMRAALSQIAFTFAATGAAWVVIERKEVTLLLAYAVGCGVGTWVIVKWKSRRSTKDTSTDQRSPRTSS